MSSLGGSSLSGPMRATNSEHAGEERHGRALSPLSNRGEPNGPPTLIKNNHHCALKTGCSRGAARGSEDFLTHIPFTCVLFAQGRRKGDEMGICLEGSGR